MKMIMAVVPRDEAGGVLDALIAAGHTATFTDSRGGMLRQAQQMLFIAVEDEDLRRVLAIIANSCHSQVTVEPSEASDPQEPTAVNSTAVAANVGGAAVFVWNLEQFEIY